jgi:hypothetical protein
VHGKQNNFRAGDFAVLTRAWGWTKAHAKERVQDLASRVSAQLPETLATSGFSEDLQERYRAIVEANTGRL